MTNHATPTMSAAKDASRGDQAAGARDATDESGLAGALERLRPARHGLGCPRQGLGPRFGADVHDQVFEVQVVIDREALGFGGPDEDRRVSIPSWAGRDA